MAVHPDVPRDVLNAAIAHAGEIRRHYPHGDSDFRTDLSHMLAEALEVFINPLGDKAIDYGILGCHDPSGVELGIAQFRGQIRTTNQGRDSLSEGGN